VRQSRPIRVPIVLVAEDDDNDYLLFQAAFQASRLAANIVRVRDGKDVLEYVRKSKELPALLLLDVKMPGKDGHEALAEIKADPALKMIPVVMFSTSTHDDDVRRAYLLGAATYLAKSESLVDMVALIGVVGSYWFDAAVLPW
jgi:two-component system response regulator